MLCTSAADSQDLKLSCTVALQMHKFSITANEVKENGRRENSDFKLPSHGSIVNSTETVSSAEPFSCFSCDILLSSSQTQVDAKNVLKELQKIGRGFQHFQPLSKPVVLYFQSAPVAQLDRALDFGSSGWGFKSLRAHERIADCQLRIEFIV